MTIRKRITLLILLVVLTTAALFIPYKQALVFEYQNTNKSIAFIPFNTDSTFQIKYTHSIHLSNVIEKFRVKHDGKMELYELEYEDFAIGMPANAGPGETFEVKNGKYFIQNMKKSFSEIDLRVGQVKANHTVIYQKKYYPLSKFIQPGTWVRMKIKKLNLIQLLRGVNILES
ncbi:DUF1850 domain-containing protein [Neobacillus sp. LXY-4]|uniref:DUF1850 domain-containing protein n=1 Tax=Neobacillus sp. LXY-4 TaxID=3379826 RepID=UPI003EE2CE9D